MPADIVDNKFNEYFKSVKDQVQVPGFRKGKVPINRLKQMFGTQARPAISRMLVEEYFTKAIRDKELNPVGNPTIEDLKADAKYPGKFDFDNSYSINLMVEVLPKIDPSGYKNLQLDFPQHDDDELFNFKMNEYRNQFAERKQITERGAELGDSLVIDFIGYIDGVPFDGGAAQGFSINKLGKGSFIPGFEDQVVGMKTEESKDIFVTFPEEYTAEHLAGKEAKFAVTVRGIIEITPAEIDGDLAMMVGCESVEELNERVKNESVEERRARDRQMLDGQITDKLLELNKFNAPKSMVEKEMLRLLGNMKMQNLPPEAKDQLHIMAEKSVKRAILMDAIYEKESDIEVTPDELDKMLNEHAEKNNMTKDQIVSNLYSSGQMDNFMGVLKTSNTMEFIINNSNKESEQDNGSE